MRTPPSPGKPSAKASKPATMLDRLTKAGYPRAEDVMFIRPNEYENHIKVHPVNDPPVGEPFVVEVTIDHQRVVGQWPSRTLFIDGHDASGRLTIRLHQFNEGLRRAYTPGNVVRVRGLIKSRRNPLFEQNLELVHPRLLPATKGDHKHLEAIYPSVGRLKPMQVRRVVTRAVELVRQAYPELPTWFRTETRTLRLWRSLEILHKPQPNELDLIDKEAIPSLKFDEWLAHIMLQQRQKLKLKRREAAPLPNQAADIDTFAREFDFELTNAQRQAMTEIAADLGQAQAMRRLLHGDVGCGKTLVAAFACWLAARAGKSSAIMCPTVILASQHHVNLAPVFARLGVACVLLVGTGKGKERKEALATIASRPGTVIIGTHALFQDKVELPALTLAVIDEQHRFGVAQRTALESKGGGAHVLMLSATPIPRTLVLGMLAHLDVTRIRERPNKGDIRTLLFSAERADDVLREIITNNLQAYWICPLVNKSAKLDLRAAEEEFARISRLAPELNAAMVHGRMDNNAKLSAMRAFQSGATRLLVATTVVEVGVDAPEADVIVIDHCDRLGLSQLHQLRGRVGRGKKTGFCALLYEAGLSETAVERLKAMRTTTDGFEIARQDLRLRGPGDIIGKRQSGERRYRFANVAEDGELLEHATASAKLLLDKDPDAATEHVRLWTGATKVPARGG